ncbi:MAG: nicotinate (nicotinamide) nucleotide adenylyltransferase [Oscillospiraceae bacterium]
MKIAIFGGSFNPIHNGHLNLIGNLDRIYGFDRIILIPTGEPPHKSGSNYASASHRLEMCRLAVENRQKYEVSDAEIVRGGTSYTIDTVRYIKEKYPESEIYLVIGGDMLMIFEKWKDYILLSRLAKVVCSARTEDEYEILSEKVGELKKSGCITELCKAPVIDVSSTVIRALVSLGKDISDCVPEKVAEYIQKNGLYKNQAD